MTGNNNIRKYGRFLRNNSGLIIFFAIAALLILSPTSKAFVMRQLLRTGLFNAHLTSSKPVTDTAANFSLALKNGQNLKVSSLRGKVVFLNFWASWCPPCRAEFPGIVDLYQRFKDNNDVVFLFVDEDNELSSGEQFLRHEKYNVPLATNIGGIPNSIYSGSLPTTVILDKAGMVRFHNEGFAAYDTPGFIEQLSHLIKE